MFSQLQKEAANIETNEKIAVWKWLVATYSESYLEKLEDTKWLIRSRKSKRDGQ
jgi:hypothetical protein